MGAYNSINGYQKILELIFPFFHAEGFTFNILAYDEWGGNPVDERFYNERGWQNYDKRILRDEWYIIKDDYDPFDLSGFFSRKSGKYTEMIQLSISTKKTITLVYGIESPTLNKELNSLALDTEKVPMSRLPFATLYHDTVYSTWSGDIQDLDEVFLQYSSDKSMQHTLSKVKEMYSGKICAYFQRGIGKELLSDIQSCKSLNGEILNAIGTITRKEFIFLNYILGSQLGVDSKETFKELNAKITISKLNDKIKEELFSLNNAILQLKSP